jgi:tetratricopeptide (TPR) repeat protein
MSKPTRRKNRAESSTPAKPVDPVVELPSIESLKALLANKRDREIALATLDEAQLFALDAMLTPSRRKRISMSKDAGDLSPLCVDAYLTLGAEMVDPEKALAVYQFAYEVGQLVLEATGFSEDPENTWFMLESRPPLRAHHTLALALWERERHDEAIQHYQAILQHNPNDNQGVRYPLMDALLELGRDSDASELLRL